MRSSISTYPRTGIDLWRQSTKSGSWTKLVAHAIHHRKGHFAVKRGRLSIPISGKCYEEIAWSDGEDAPIEAPVKLVHDASRLGC